MVRCIPTLLVLLLLALTSAAEGAGLVLDAPLEYQVMQRTSKSVGPVVVSGRIADREIGRFEIECRVIADAKAGPWRGIPITGGAAGFRGQLEVPAGGWYRLEVKAVADGKVIAESVVEHVGVGEVFVVAGQSNSANHGQEKQTTKTGKVTAFDGKRWQLANDPQPGASGGGGSFMPPLGDAIAERYGVPVGFVACGIGASSVREWLPKGMRFPNPPTIESRVQKSADGQWECKGQAFEMFTGRMSQLGPRGFRAVLWHQGESDANQRDATRTLPGKLYREYLEKLIRDSRKQIAWEAPWFVAQVSYHVPGDEASPDIRSAQASLWKDGIALEGPDSDALKSEWRERDGKGVHFSGPGLRQHASRWFEKISPWLDGLLEK
ncbi:sialate O-acetylesterase [Humisphaera borealis]|uniref:Sialate O-acetylesterase domain-containing protein n=1 Tax=Humisphaera borealis TaxID=2807512 RepID=A0A7M2WT32_9BACT|nr:sialate O-acetylesterase [Humisphaera borealis]QOV88685.1 hypothetical protein IPV69_20980 [Humisphaera borealis]